MKNGIRALVKLHKKFNVSVTGIKGSGKDVLQGNVIARIRSPYISNVDYTHDDRFNKLDLTKFDMNGNTYENFISGDLKKYVYPYPDKYNVYISDAGNYFPSQYNSQLDKKYGYFATWASLQRQLGDSTLCYNAQAYERVWNKLREQNADCFIRCDKCFVPFGKIVIATYYFYDKAESCQARIKPCRVSLPLFASREQKLQYRLYKDNFYNTYGTVQKRFYICINKSKHDSRLFKTMLENAQGGVINEKNLKKN